MILIDNKNYYPTPENVLDIMFKGVDIINVEAILEPSAGKGDIVDYIYKKYDRYERHNNFNIDCIEKDPTLRATLKGKEYRVIHDDFLTFQTYKKYDLIVMNPPFSDGDKHLLKALTLIKQGGSIICLLNAETLKNPHTKARQKLKEELKDISQITYHKGLFLDAERKTDVEIALVKASVVSEKILESEYFERMRKAHEYEEIHSTPEQENKIVHADIMDMFKEMVRMYHIEVEAGINFIREYDGMKKHILSDLKEPKDNGYDYRRPILKLKLDNDKDVSINGFVKTVRYKYWKGLMSNEVFVGKLTNNLRNEFSSTIQKMKDYEFSIYNILVLHDELMMKTIDGIKRTILTLFDELSHKYSYYDETSKNVHYFNGWKTNKAHKINKKVIIPFYLFERWGSVNTYNAISKFEDMTKIFDYLDCGKTVYDHSIEDTIRYALDSGNFKNISLKYFNITFYKKGTAHIVFKDEKLLEKFNLFGCQRKGWLPPDYGKKPYNRMDKEEKELVKEFSGSEANYNEVYVNCDYYVIEDAKLLN